MKYVYVDYERALDKRSQEVHTFAVTIFVDSMSDAEIEELSRWIRISVLEKIS